MKNKLSKWVSILIPLIIGIALIIYQYNSFTQNQLLEIKGYFKNANYLYIYISLFIALLGVISRSYRWKFSIEQMGYTSAFKNNFMAVCICYFMNLSIPRSGEISRAVILKKYEKIPFGKAFGTIIAERIVDTILFFFFVVLGFILQFGVIKDFILNIIPFEKLILLFIVGIIGFIVFCLIWIYSNFKIIAKLKEKLSGLIEGMMSVLNMKNKWAFLFHSLFIWGSYIAMFYVTIFALPETSNISFNAVIIGFIFGTLAIGFTNSGFGAYPLLVAQIFVLYGVSNTAGTAFGWLVWTSQTILTIVLGGLSFLFLPILNRK